MFSVGLELETSHFKELARNKGTFFAALIGQMIVSPAIGVFIVRTIPLPEYLQVGILLVAACPVGDIANFYTLLARGNVALSVAVNSVSCLLSVASMSVVFAVYRSLFGSEFALSVPPFRLLGRLILMVALPIVAGMVFRVLRAELVGKVSRNLRTLCVGGILALCMFVIVNRHAQLRADWKAIWLSKFIPDGRSHGLWLGNRSGYEFKESGLNCICHLISSSGNIAIAAAIAVSIMGRLEYAAFATAYFLSEALLLLGVVAFLRYRSSVAPLANSAPEGAIQP